MDQRTLVQIGVWICVAFLVWQAYLLMFRPMTWVKWAFQRPWKFFGITATVTDEKQLRMVTMLYGVTMLLIALVITAAVLLTRFGCIYSLLGMPCRG